MKDRNSRSRAKSKAPKESFAQTDGIYGERLASNRRESGRDTGSGLSICNVRKRWVMTDFYWDFSMLSPSRTFFSFTFGFGIGVIMQTWSLIDNNLDEISTYVKRLLDNNGLHFPHWCWPLHWSPWTWSHTLVQAEKKEKIQTIKLHFTEPVNKFLSHTSVNFIN